VRSTMGGVDPTKGIDGEWLQFVLSCLDTAMLVKLGAHLQEDDFPFSDTDPLGRNGRARAEPLLWGSDCRIRNTSSRCRTTFGARPDARLVPDEATRKKIFVDIPPSCSLPEALIALRHR